MLKILLIILISFYVAFSFYPGAIWGWYRQGLPIVYLLLLTIPISYLFEKTKYARLNFLILGMIFLVYTINPKNTINQLTERSQRTSGIGEQKEIIDYVYQSSGGKNFSYFAYTPPVYDYIWQYNFWWYGQKQYHYLPNNWQMGVPLLGIGEQQKPPQDGIGLFYLIIEPDNDRPWAPDGWKKSFIKVGVVEEKKEFPSGTMVEKKRA